MVFLSGGIKKPRIIDIMVIILKTPPWDKTLTKELKSY